MNSTSWLVSRTGEEAPRRLYCFPYAGGSAFHFLPWQDSLSPHFAIYGVQLPGHGTRLRESPPTSLPELVKQLSDVISAQETHQFAFFGHSFGGLIAFELARYLSSRGLRPPAHLFVSGCDAPQCPGPPSHLHELNDYALIEALRELNGTPMQVFDSRELMDIVLPGLRADFALAETYVYVPGPPLNIPITVLAGRRDTLSLVEQVGEWRRETTKSCRVQWFDGDHFFINSEREAVVNCLNTELKRSMNTEGL